MVIQENNKRTAVKNTDTYLSLINFLMLVFTLLNSIQSVQGSDTTVINRITAAGNIKNLLSKNEFNFSKNDNDFEGNLNL
jgi:hypothetical protein